MKWVTRERPVIDRIACPWLIARFIDKQPEFLFVPPDQVSRVAAETGAIPYDIPGVRAYDMWVKERCGPRPRRPRQGNLNGCLAGNGRSHRRRSRFRSARDCFRLERYWPRPERCGRREVLPSPFPAADGRWTLIVD